MEWKIGEIKQVNGEWYQCVEGNGCENCAFYGRKCYTFTDDNDPVGDCCSERRRDNKDVIFKKLEKVGEPFTGNVHIQLQRYKIYTEPIVDSTANVGYINEENTIVIEIKENKEDVEEKKPMTKKLKEYLAQTSKEQLEKDLELSKRFNEAGVLVDEFIKSQDKLFLKPFDLEAAKSGKPVCTRDGRKERIICFDAKFPKTGNIVALVEKENGEEVILYYYDDGHCSIGRGYDLMMLPEKKEGWVNVRRLKSPGDNDFPYVSTLYPTKEEAITNANLDVIDTIKISWEG